MLDEALVFSAGGFAALVVDCAGGLVEGLEAEVCFVGATDGWLAEVVCFVAVLLEWLAWPTGAFVGGVVGACVAEGLGCDAGGVTGGAVGDGLGGWDRLISAPTSPACVSRSAREVSVPASGRRSCPFFAC